MKFVFDQHGNKIPPLLQNWQSDPILIGNGEISYFLSAPCHAYRPELRNVDCGMMAHIPAQLQRFMLRCKDVLRRSVALCSKQADARH